MNSLMLGIALMATAEACAEPEEWRCWICGHLVSTVAAPEAPATTIAKWDALPYAKHPPIVLGAPASEQQGIFDQLAIALRSANLLLAETFISTGTAMSQRAQAVSEQIERALAAADGEEQRSSPEPVTHKLECTKCGIDRFEAPCPNQGQCGLIGEALVAVSPDAAAMVVRIKELESRLGQWRAREMREMRENENSHGEWQLVPREPTPEMIEAGARDGVQGDFDNDLSNGVKELSRKIAASNFKAMLAAAPVVPVAAGTVEVEVVRLMGREDS